MSAMTEQHKDILRESRTFLVDNITETDRVIDKLYEMKILNDHMRDSIKGVNDINSYKTRRLLDKLPTRGPLAFDAFVEALRYAGEDSCVSKLQLKNVSPNSCAGLALEPPGVPCEASEWRRDLRKIWSDPRLDPRTVSLIRCKGSPYFEQMKQKMQEPDVYPMSRKPRGYCLIINNELFEETSGLSFRKGTFFDCSGLSELFACLMFDVKIKHNLTGKKMLAELRKYANLDHGLMDCFILFILSHGNLGCVYGTDKGLVKITDMQNLFNNRNCQSLKGKPKLLFIQACQGNQYDSGVDSASSSSASSETVTETFASMNLQGEDICDAPGGNKIATDADMCTVIATTEGNTAWRNKKQGSWFIQAVIMIFKCLSHCETLTSMVDKINYWVNAKETVEGYKQVSTRMGSLTKDFYFFPGLVKTDAGVEHLPHH